MEVDREEAKQQNNVLFEPEIYRQRQFDDAMSQNENDITVVGAFTNKHGGVVVTD